MKNKSRISDVIEINLKIIKSEESSLFVFENINAIFEIKRVFSITGDTKKEYQRGRHAHKKDQQIITCPHGAIRFTVFDGTRKKIYFIDSPQKAIFVPCYIWTETDYLKNKTVVTVYSSQPYDENSYIREYDDFLKIVNQN